MIILVALVYFVPTFMALNRWHRHGHPMRVFLINLLTGWTVIGWFAALLYCAAGEKKRDRQHRELVEAVSAAKH
jgi:Superinfection immunity protein